MGSEMCIRDRVGDVDGIPVYVTTFGEVVDLPEEEEGRYYIVSALVRAAAPGRQDLLSPGDPVRDGEGRVIGCRSFDRNPA